MDHPEELLRDGAVIQIKTKAGELSVGDGCNSQFETDVLENGVVLGMDLDHRSEDISAVSQIQLSPGDARAVGEWLFEAADAAESNQR